MIVVTIGDIIGFIISGLVILGILILWIICKIDDFKEKKKRDDRNDRL